MVSVKNEINEVLLNCVSDLENRLDESRTVLSDIQEKMDSKVSEAKEYKVQVDDAKENIKKLEDEIKTLENDLVELKEKYGKKNLVAVIDAGTREINAEIKKKQDEIQNYKNKIAELTNRARSIKDLLMNLKKDKKIKEDRLNDLENCTNYYKVRLENIVKFSEEHDDLDDYFAASEDENIKIDNNVFEDIVSIEEKETNIFNDTQEEVSLEEADEVFNDVINTDEDDDGETKAFNDNELIVEPEIEEKLVDTNNKFEMSVNSIDEEITDNNYESDELENREIEISDLLSAVKAPLIETDTNINNAKFEDDATDKVDKIAKSIDDEFANVFGQDINEPIKTVDFFGNEIVTDSDNEEDIVNKLTNIGLDYYSFTESDRDIIKTNFNEQVITDIVEILKSNKIQLDNVYVDGKFLSSIAPAELSNIVNKLVDVGQSADAIGYVLDKLPLVDSKMLDITISNYGDYIKNVDIVDIVFKSLKGDK